MQRSGAATSLRATSSLGLAVFVVATVAMMIVPLPTPLLDVLLTSNLAISVALLLVAVWSARTLELSTFPTLLLLTTLYRLALNVSSVRLILLQANAGRVIHAFGAFVVRGDYVVGFAVFLILTIVQYVVISRGAERVAEVAARFTLDAMPGKQLAIDADLRAGAIDADEARRRRDALSKEAALYGALDGAMRFVKGDAIAGLLILAISLTGGLVIGVVQRGMPLGDAARVYTLLTIGDGLVSQLPALLISTAAGLVVTRVASDEDGATLGPDLARQLLRPGALVTTAVLLARAGARPRPAAVAVPRRRRRRRRAGVAGAAPPRAGAARPRRRRAARAAARSRSRSIRRCTRRRPSLEARLVAVTRALSDELGLIVPPLTLTIDAALPLRGYEIRLRGVPLADGIIPDGRILVDVAPDKLPAGVDGQPTDHPATGAPASWVPASSVARLPASGLDDARRTVGDRRAPRRRAARRRARARRPRRDAAPARRRRARASGAGARAGAGARRPHARRRRAAPPRRRRRRPARSADGARSARARRRRDARSGARSPSACARQLSRVITHKFAGGRHVSALLARRRRRRGRARRAALRRRRRHPRARARPRRRAPRQRRQRGAARTSRRSS